ncbi:multiprotein-bridging factor 1 family protein [Streptomyces sp. NPDC003090]|uniref:helix-turn-helix domain-containing protein n=1 Tax=Streptomyces sp. NPDC003090 TaxID=3154274 RepID=UPI003801A910
MAAQQEDGFGAWLRRRLESTGTTPAELADRLGLTVAPVSAWIAGRSQPQEQVRRALADLLGGAPVPSSHGAGGGGTSPLLRWHHRPAHADGGREYGNPAAFAFDADLSVLAREATQNSLDERWDPERPVRVEYTLHELSGDHLESFLRTMQWDALRPHYVQAASAEQKVARSLRAALHDLEESGSLLLLRVDDYNAAGLTGPEYHDGRFAAVVRRQLDSHKQHRMRAGGSYGLGKATLWATSRFGLVLINSTLSEPHEGRTRARVAGRLDLPWHQVDGQAFAGPAWFGTPDADPGHEGVSRSWWADERTVRELYLERADVTPGTSFLIVGAHDASGDAESLQEMHDKLVRSLADGFWAAMVGGRSAEALLEARVTTLRNGEVLIPQERVDPHAHHPALSRAMRAYFDGETTSTLKSADQVACVEVPLVVPPLKGQGRGRSKGREHRAVLLLTPAGDTDVRHSRVVCMRGSRMTITEYRPRELPLGTPPFQAVLLAGYATGRDGQDVEEAEAFLRASEPPEHDRWDRTEELTSAYERGALSRLREFRAEMDKAVRGLVGRRETPRGEGPGVLRDLLRLDAASSGGRRTQSFPAVRAVQANLDEHGAWHVTVSLRLPDAADPWVLTPVAKFDVRSGGRPAVGWAELTASDGCRIEEGNLLIDAGRRTAVFSGVTDPSSHPVRAALARLVVDIQKARGGAS